MERPSNFSQMPVYLFWNWEHLWYLHQVLEVFFPSTLPSWMITHFFLKPTPHLPCCIFKSLFSLLPVRLYPISWHQSLISSSTAVTVSTVSLLFPPVSFNLSHHFKDLFKTHLSLLGWSDQQKLHTQNWSQSAKNCSFRRAKSWMIPVVLLHWDRWGHRGAPSPTNCAQQPNSLHSLCLLSH